MEPDVEELRGKSLIKIKGDVLKAINNPVVIDIDPVANQIEQGELKNEILKNLHDYEIIEIPEPDYTGIAYVTNAHEYPYLLRTAYEEFKNRTNSKMDIEKEVIADTQHELEHSIPGLGNDDLQILYCVRFISSRDGSSLSVQPLLQLLGKTTVAEYKDITSNASVLSLADKAVLRE